MKVEVKSLRIKTKFFTSSPIIVDLVETTDGHNVNCNVYVSITTKVKQTAPK